MESLPARELLEAVHEFPCKFVFKAVGPAREEFVTTVVSVVRSTLAHEFDPPFETRQTPSGRHVSVTVAPWVESSEEVLLVYTSIRDIPGLLMLF